MNTLNVEYRKVEALIPYARNPRTHAESQIAKIAASIVEYGWTNPILVDGENGIIAGSMLVFIPVVGEFVIPELLGGPETLMIGKVLWQEFFNNRDWPVASALAVVMLAILIVPIILFNRNQAKELEGRP
ncbi:MAG: ABC transporter permease subunit [Betaproteobacteria bacterium]|nr:ABC transporter permease subunit [Betaproteobacteria bacterium]